jgi:hypothetical protein
VGFRAVLLAGTACFVGGLLCYALSVGVHPDFAARWLPGIVLTGVGIGLTFPVLGAAAVSSLHPDRFAVGSAVNQTARQVGGAVGVALLVVILGSPHSPAAAVTSAKHLWVACAVMAGASGVAAIGIGGRRKRVAALAPASPTIEHAAA